MCGRYAASASADRLVETFEVDEVVAPGPDPAPWLLPRWNIAPTDPVAVVMERAGKQNGEVTRRLAGLRWGLVPSWSKGPKSQAPLINARLETVTEKPSFRKPMASRRCILPADGYYEWYALTEPDGSPVLTPRGKPSKQPFYIHPVSGPMVMAGLYEYWRDPSKPPEDEDAWVVSTCIITTRAIDELGHIHDRMPVQLEPGRIDAWLDPTLTDAAAAVQLLHLPEPGEMTAHAVSTAVNTVKNDGPELVQPLPDEDFVQEGLL
ncbi:SOS response-associated peptidase [Aestuariimicrobium kwangyangense]|uniref:SOS response-associated peptidase n=1 Tax=Aestuariimicrobium kwangyangense TaxID=396389 RepID=UPI0003B3D61B|nr:SOS response-associated peptidase [Aestuariimicrobium kwangyangense]